MFDIGQTAFSRFTQVNSWASWPQLLLHQKVGYLLKEFPEYVANYIYSSSEVFQLRSLACSLLLSAFSPHLAGPCAAKNLASMAIETFCHPYKSKTRVAPFFFPILGLAVILLPNSFCLILSIPISLSQQVQNLWFLSITNPRSLWLTPSPKWNVTSIFNLTNKVS